MSDKLQVWSCGGGTQSCAIGALIVQGRLPKPDVCVIADTGRETRATWEYLDGVLNPALSKVGLEVVRVKSEEWGLPWGRGIFSSSENGHIQMPLMPVYTTANGKGKITNFCTKAWKYEPINRWLSQVLGITRGKNIKWIGFSRDEQRRIISMMDGEEFKKGLIRFPLVEAGVTRREAISLVESMGWPTPPRSACWMCPNHGDHEWRDIIKFRPDEFQKAVELEREMRAVDPDAWLHRSCVPLDQVDFSQPEDLFSRPCDSGQCFV